MKFSTLVNTGWCGNSGKRMNLKYTRAMVTAALNGELEKAEFVTDPYFGVQVPTSCPGVPDEQMIPAKQWGDDQSGYDTKAKELAKAFVENFKQYTHRHKGSAEAGGEGGHRGGDAPLGARQLAGEAGDEVVLGLLLVELGDGGHDAVGVGGEEDDGLGGAADAGGGGGPERDHVHSEAAIMIDYEKKMVLIAGSQYAGEIKKSVFSVSLRLGSAERVVLPVPERPKNTAASPASPMLAEQCMGNTPSLGIR